MKTVIGLLFVGRDAALRNKVAHEMHERLASLEDRRGGKECPRFVQSHAKTMDEAREKGLLKSPPKGCELVVFDANSVPAKVFTLLPAGA